MRLLQLVSYWSTQRWFRPIGRQGWKHLQKTVSQALATYDEGTNIVKLHKNAHFKGTLLLQPGQTIHIF